MGLPEYEQALNEGYEFLNNHNQLLHSLQLSRIDANHRTYSKETQNVGNEPVEPSQGVGEVGGGVPA